jgi:hypothetical protein
MLDNRHLYDNIRKVCGENLAVRRMRNHLIRRTKERARFFDDETIGAGDIFGLRVLTKCGIEQLYEKNPEVSDRGPCCRVCGAGSISGVLVGKRGDCVKQKK